MNTVIIDGMTKAVRRLFRDFQPDNYDLRLVPERDSMTFSGEVTISGQKVGRPSQRLTFHQKELRIISAQIVKHDKRGDHEFTTTRVNHHRSFDEVRIHTEQVLYPGSYTVTLTFSGKITRAMNGLYPCVFTHQGQKKQLLATQFESHHAREVFPCIDEPEAKATFDLSLVSPAKETVIANTPVKKQTIAAGLMTTTFETTPRMSSYLLAFVYGELAYKEAKTKDGVIVRAYTTPQNVDRGSFALDVAVKCLEFYNDYFGIPYPLPKCDLIALPDFASGAMENWGCITFREQTLLVDERHTGLATKQYVAMVVAHELAHQWFGNLVTMRWWTDLWLNEGFASWIEFLAVDHLFPEWEMWTQFTVDEQQQALKLDALENTHPIEVPVSHPDEIRSIFDAISYSKGASVIHMLHEYLGPQNFQGGLRHYLNRHAYNNTDTVDLWQALEEVSGKPVKAFMHAWTSQPGFPLLHVSIDEENVELRQERFFLNPEHESLPAQLWPIPLPGDRADIPNQLDEETQILTSSDAHDLILNRGQSGFYRVSYNSTHLERLGEVIRKGHMAPLDRLGILSNVFETARAGESDTADALQFLKNFAHETNYAAWDVIAGVLGNLKLIMDSEQIRNDMKPFISKLVKNELERLGWERKKNESHFDRLLRPIILGLSASADDPDTIARCREIFDVIEHVEEVKPDLRVAASNRQVKRSVDIDPDMRGVVFGTIARHGNTADFNKLVALHNNSALSEERMTIAAAITGFRQPELVQRALGMIDSEAVRMQDVAYWIAYSFLNRYAKKATWEWVKAHWVWLEQNLGTDLSFYRLPIYVARVYSDHTFIDEYVTFFKPRLSPALDRSYRQGLEMLSWQSAWRKRSHKEVAQFFKANLQ
jgi:puromycin-sensitive aminopeptidase